MYDFSREQLLRVERPPKPKPSIIWRNIPPVFPPPRIKPREIAEWVDFGEDLHRYWSNQVTQSDKEDLIAIAAQIPWDLDREELFSENSFGVDLHTIPFKYLTQATQGLGKDDALPSDKHSDIQWFSDNLGFVGDPDYIFVQFDDAQEQRRRRREPAIHSPRPLQSVRSKPRITAVVIAKNPYRVTPTGILRLLKGSEWTEDETKDAVDQIFGYMAVNAKSLGLIRTSNGYVFLKREAGGMLWMTKMYGCDSSAKGGMEELGYANFEGGYTVNQALYYFSHLADETPDIVEHWGHPDTLFCMSKEYEDSTLPISFPMYGLCTWSAYWISYIKFEPWKQGTQLGIKNWIANLRYRNGERKVMLKLWDPDKPPPKERPANYAELRRDNEVAIYKELHSLWGDCVPRLIAYGPVYFCHGLITQFIEDAEHLSQENMTPDVEQQVLTAYGKLHGLGIVHDRPKPGNILVAKGKVWIIDFERSERYAILEEGKRYLDLERASLLDMIKRIKEGKDCG